MEVMHDNLPVQGQPGFLRVNSAESAASFAPEVLLVYSLMCQRPDKSYLSNL